jgi:hypothetical protein
MSAPADTSAALACVLEDVAHRLHCARELLLEMPDANATTWGALALICEAGALADRATKALGGFPVAGTGGEWQLGPTARDALALLEGKPAGAEGGAP